MIPITPADKPDDTDQNYIVSGRVTYAGGKAAAGLIVRARDHDLRRFQSLGKETRTRADGCYEIEYTRSNFIRAEKDSADLVIRVFSTGQPDPDKPLAESSILFNAPQHAEIDLVIPDSAFQRSEFERHLDDILPLLAGQKDDGGDVAMSELTDSDVDFLAGETGIDRQRIVWLKLAFEFTAKVQTNAYSQIAAQKPATTSHISPALFYGWFREGLTDEWDNLIKQPAAILRSTAHAAITDLIIPGELAGTIDSVVDSLPNPGRDEVRRFADAAGLDQQSLKTILQTAAAIPEISNTTLSRLIDEKKLDASAAHRFGLGLAAHELLSGNEPAITALLQVKNETLTDGLRRARDLAKLDANDIEKALSGADVTPPGGLSASEYAHRLAGQISEAFPTDALLHRATTVDGNLIDSIHAVVGSRDHTTNNPEQQQTVQDFVNLHPGLRLQKVLDDASGDSTSAVATIKERVGWIELVNDLNPDLDLLSVEYLPDSESLAHVSFGDLSAEARSMVIDDFKTYQRLKAVSTGVDRIALLTAGYRSATRIARATAEEIATSTGLPVTTARAYKRRAQQKANEAALSWFTAYGLERDKRTINQRTFVQPPDYLKRLPGYQELFNDLSFCNCEQCQSVLGACAYFVDLMFYVERHISDGSFKNHGGEQNSLHLKSRRSDLWTVQLSCDNTNKVVPTLDLVIDLLERFIVKDKQFNSVPALYEQLSNVDYSIRLPFSLPLERLIIFLGHLGISRYQIAQSLLLRDENNLVKARVRLGMLPKQYQLITTSRLGNLSVAAITAAEQFFIVWLNANLTLSTIPGQTETRAIDVIDSLLLMKAARVSRTTLGGVVSSKFVNGDVPGAPPPIEFEIGIATPGGLQNDAERLKNFTAGRLDRFERFVRLWQHLPWTVVELDYVIQHLQAQHHLSNTINEQIIIDLAQLLELQTQFALTVEELCALWDSPPQIPLQTEISLLDRLFNLPQFLRGDISWPTNNTTIDAGPMVRARLVAGLQLTDADLTELISNLNNSFGRTVTDAQGNRTFTAGLWLNLDNLSLLYRHARLARLLQLSIDELFATIRWTSNISNRAVNERCVLSLSDLLSVLETHRWRKASGFSVDEIAFITQPGTTLAGYDDPTAIADRIVSEGASERPLDIAPGLFTQVGLTQEESTNLIDDNAAAPGVQPLLVGVPGSESRQISPSISFDSVAAQFTFSIDPNPSTIAQLGQALYRIAKQAGDGGIAAVDIESLGLSATEATALLNANSSSTAVPPTLFELVPNTTDHYRLKSVEIVNAAIAAFGATAADVNAARSFLKQQALALLLRHHTDAVLAAKASAAAKTTPEKARALLSLVTPNDAAQREALVGALQGGQMTVLVTTLDQLIRSSVLFRSTVFDEQALEFIRTNPAALALNGASPIETVRRVSDYVALATPPDPAYQSGESNLDLSALRAILIRPASIASVANADFPTLARAVNGDESQIRALLPNISFATGAATAPRIEELTQLKSALVLVNDLGMPAEILARAISEQFSDLSNAADGIFAAVRSKYVDEQSFQDKYQPFEDKLRSRNRDGLVEYILTAPDDATTDWRTRFLNSNDLYYHFLTDVMVEGCARTSRIVFAISSLQLYVQRVLMNLEATSNGSSFTVTFDDEEKRGEWVWRKNYQVWVANRKVFLFPENYIEPSLRDDKTPAFRTLEDTLLQKQINEQNTLDAYATYLRDFEELGQLRISGAFHDRAMSNGDILHLFGVTVGNPPVHYYRAVKDLETGDGPIFSAWEKVDLQIPTRKISPVVFHGTLFIFWVETTTRPMNSFTGGTSSFFAYRHSTHLKYSTLRKDGRWSPPQSLRFIDKTGAALDPFLKDDYLRNISPSGPILMTVLTDLFRRDHSQSIENYVPEGWQWEQAYPYRLIGQNNQESLAVRFDPEFADTDKASFCNVDLWPGTLLINSTTKFSYPLIGFMPSSTSLDIVPIAGQGLPFYCASRVLFAADTGTQELLSATPLLFTSQATQVQVVNGNEMSAIVQAPGDSFLLRAQFSNPDPNWFSSPNTSTDPDYELLRLGTTIANDVGVKVTADGIAGMLDIKYQMNLKEIDPVVTPATTSITSDVHVEPTKNAAGLPYFRELFFQIPFLIADHLNSQQKFSDSQRWYHYLFNPTANESNVSEDKRPWRYREFREHDITSMRDAMVNQQALAAYRQDPFNPHAIARLRPGAYQKAIFMKYIDNLLDWGDSLFTQFTMESVNEATMLYVMAADILGPRPIELGSCGESTATLTYTSVAPLLKDDSSDFLIEEFETFVSPTDPGHHQFIPTPTSQRALLLSNPLTGVATFTSGQLAGGPPNPAGWNVTGAPAWKETAGTPLGNLQAGGSLQLATAPEVGGATPSELKVSGDPVGPPDESPFGGFELNGSNFGPLGAPKGFDRSDFMNNVVFGLDDAPPPLGGKFPGGVEPPQLQPSELVQSRLVFCFPENKELLGYWDRVDDRLNKIRNCMDISGVSRRLELFAPEIDPRMLVRMRAAGLTLDDVMNVTSGNLPPYRFAYLIEKAKAFASVVQSFGNQVMSALERRDTEELTRLRTVHEQNILKLRSQMTQWEIDSAEDTLEGLRRQKLAVEYRRDHYSTLLQSGLSGSETVQQLATHLVSGLHEVEAIVQLVRAALSLLPQLGAPTAMKYGGMETSGAAAGFASVSQALAQASAAAAASAGVEATFQRRDEEWRHQIQLANLELNEIDRQIAAEHPFCPIPTQNRRARPTSILPSMPRSDSSSRNEE